MCFATRKPKRTYLPPPSHVFWPHAVAPGRLLYYTISAPRCKAVHSAAPLLPPSTASFLTAALCSVWGRGGQVLCCSAGALSGRLDSTRPQQ